MKENSGASHMLTSAKELIRGVSGEQKSASAGAFTSV